MRLYEVVTLGTKGDPTPILFKLFNVILFTVYSWGWDLRVPLGYLVLSRYPGTKALGIYFSRDATPRKEKGNRYLRIYPV